MQGPTHMAGGMAAVMAYTMLSHPIISPPQVVAAAAVGVVGGLLPDIDHPSSKISNKIKPVGAIISFVFTHRGLFHSPAFYLILFALWNWWAPEQSLFWGNVLFIGIASHLLLDFLNPGGIPVFFPFETKKRRLLRIKTGGFIEWFVRIFLYLACIGLMVIQLFPSYI